MKLCHPQPVKIAVGISCHWFVSTEVKGCSRSVSRHEPFKLTALVGLHIDPLDIMLGNHWMWFLPNIHTDNTVVNGDHRLVNHHAGVYRIRPKLLHFPATTTHWHPCISHHSYNISTATTAIKFRNFHKKSS